MIEKILGRRLEDAVVEYRVLRRYVSFNDQMDIESRLEHANPPIHSRVVYYARQLRLDTRSRQ